MVILLSLQKNKSIDKISVVILCAGEGTRIKDLTKDSPKPLLKIEALNNKTILHDTINKLVSIKINRIVIVKGHLGHKIEEFVNSLVNNNSELKNILRVIDSGTRYKLGPLYSFLSITKSNLNDKKNHIYLVIPGDTIFQANLLASMVSSVVNNIRIMKHHPFVFYKKLKGIALKEKFKEKPHGLISIAEIEKKEKDQLLLSITQKKLQELSNSEQVRFLIPVFAFSNTVIKNIIEVEEKNPVKTIREVINLMINGGKIIHAMNVPNEYEFYDIDEKVDIVNFNIEKR